MNLDILKSAVGMVVTSGVGIVVKNAIKATTPEDLKRSERIFVTVGTFAVSGIVGKAASDYVGGQIDKVSDSISAGVKAGKSLHEKKALKIDLDTDVVKEVVDEALDEVKSVDYPMALFHPDSRIEIAENWEDVEKLLQDGFYPSLSDARSAKK